MPSQTSFVLDVNLPPKNCSLNFSKSVNALISFDGENLFSNK